MTAAASSGIAAAVATFVAAYLPVVSENFQALSRFCELKRVVYCSNSTAATCVFIVS